jgi:hypothetical protein
LAVSLTTSATVVMRRTYARAAVAGIRPRVAIQNADPRACS